MKRFLLGMAACAMMAGSADAMYLIGAPAGDWSPAIGIEMEEVDGGWKWSGTVAETDFFAFATELGADSNDWDNFNANFRISPDGGDGTAAYAGEYGMHVGHPAGAFHGVGVPVTYFVKEDNGAYTLTVSYDGEEPPTPTDEVWSVIGEFSNWSDDVDMTQTVPGVWSVTMDVLEGEFKFRKDHDWTVNYGAMAYPTGEELDPNVWEIEHNGGNFWIDPSFRVTLRLDLNAQLLYIEYPKPLGMRGSFNGWGWNDEYLFEQQTPGIFTLHMDTVKAEWEFKVSNDDWSENYGSDFAGMLPATNYDLLPDGPNMTVANDYNNVVWTLNLLNNTLSFTGDIDTSVAEIEAADGTARYYNLQGVEIEKPAKGLYIRVANGKSEKVLVK